MYDFIDTWTGNYLGREWKSKSESAKLSSKGCFIIAQVMVKVSDYSFTNLCKVGEIMQFLLIRIQELECDLLGGRKDKDNHTTSSTLKPLVQ